MMTEPSEKRAVRLVDSITELGPSDAGCIAISGSHGGLSSARYALAAQPRLSVFNDAGVGKDGAGIAGLHLLQQAGLAALAVSNSSACIGLAESSWREGVVSHLNAAAAGLGFVAGRALAPQIEALAERDQSARRTGGPS